MCFGQLLLSHVIASFFSHRDKLWCYVMTFNSMVHILVFPIVLIRCYAASGCCVSEEDTEDTEASTIAPFLDGNVYLGHSVLLTCCAMLR
jgi:hypothetical protein